MSKAEIVNTSLSVVHILKDMPGAAARYYAAQRRHALGRPVSQMRHVLRNLCMPSNKLFCRQN